MRRLVAVGAAVLVLAAGCGDDDSADTGTVPAEQVPAEPEETNVVSVELSEFAIDPARASGGDEGLVTIRIRNVGETPHSLAVEGPNGLVELDGRVDPGARATLEVDLDKPGTYAWYCPLDAHRAKGMDGSITVSGTNPARGPESDDTGGTTTTQTGTTERETETETRTQTETQTRTTTQTETVTTPTETDDGPTATVRTPSDE